MYSSYFIHPEIGHQVLAGHPGINGMVPSMGELSSAPHIVGYSLLEVLVLKLFYVESFS